MRLRDLTLGRRELGWVALAGLAGGLGGYTQSGDLTPGQPGIVAAAGAVAASLLAFGAAQGWDAARQRRAGDQGLAEVLELLPLHLPPVDPPRPTAVLTAERGLASFRGRRDDGESLLQWCVAEGGPVVGVLSGSAGVGKTRLALRLAEHCPSVGWSAGCGPAARRLRLEWFSALDPVY